MKTFITTILIFGLTIYQAVACPVCERNQPKIFKGLVHGAGPDGNMDYIIVGLITLISVVALVLAIKQIFRPGEKGKDHIKRFVINTEDHE